MIRMVVAFAACGMLSGVLFAQGPGRGRGEPAGRSGPPDRFGPPGFNLMTALDANQDGKLSAAEIDAAEAALRKLDKDKDGKLTRAEIGWPPTFSSRGGGFLGGSGGGPPRFGGRFSVFDGNGRPLGGPTAEQSHRTKRSFFSSKMLRRLDRDEDGKIGGDELPQRMKDEILKRLDRNQNGIVDRAELDAFSEAGHE